MFHKYEILSFSESNPVRCTLRKTDGRPMHLHDFFEIDLILAGECRISIGEQRYLLHADDLVCVNAHTPHMLLGSDCVYISIQFEQSLFERTLPQPKHPDFFCNSTVSGNAAAFDALRSLIARLVKNNADQQPGYELRNWALVYELMDVMYNNFRVEASDIHTQRSFRYAERIAQISRIINENYQSNLTLTELADRMHLSAPYLSKFFDTHFGFSFLSYLAQVRLNHAVKELLETDHTIETVSADSGFPNSQAFVQAFKKEYGLLPSTYRRQMRHTPAAPTALPQPDQHDYMAGLRKYLKTPAAVSSPAQTVICNVLCPATAQQAQLRHTWRKMLAVSSASLLLAGDVQQMIRRIQTEIGFEAIKFNGILSDEMHIYSEDAGGKAVYSFLYVDKVLDFLCSVGLKPLLQLSFMPSLLAKEPKYLFNYLVSEPKELSQWADLVTALIAHIVHRYGVATARSWLFSVWEQPDTPKELYGFSSAEYFYTFYERTYRAVKAVDSGLTFGAPSTFYILGEDHTNWYLPFLAWCRKRDCFPDFLNFHYYDTVFAEEDLSGQDAFGFPMAMNLRNTPDGFSDFVTQVIKERSENGLEALPVYLTEWNNTPSQQDLLNDTCFKACYIVKGILENYDRLDSFAYWSLTDWMGESPQPAELFHGGLGLFTANGIPKSSYYAFAFLNRLGDTLLGRGEGWFATRRDEEYVFLFYNYRHFSHLYALGERFDMTFTDRYTPFSPEQSLDVHFRLTDLPDGTYRIKETILNRNSGSAFDRWVAIGAEELQTAEDLDTLARLSVPSFTQYMLSAKDGRLELSTMLEMLEVRLVEIGRK